MKKMFRIMRMMILFGVLALVVNDTLGCDACYNRNKTYVFLGDGITKMRLNDFLDQEYEAEKAIDKINDLEILTEIAKNGTNEFVRIFAIEKLNDQALFCDLVKNDKNEFVRNKAFSKLDDPTLLLDVAQNASTELMRNGAVEKLEKLKNPFGFPNNKKSVLLEEKEKFFSISNHHFLLGVEVVLLIILGVLIFWKPKPPTTPKEKT